MREKRTTTLQGRLADLDLHPDFHEIVFWIIVYGVLDLYPDIRDAG
jgi:hypothetical protein